MSYIVKGYPGATHVATMPRYDGETRTKSFRYEFEGPEAAIRGMEAQLEARGLSYNVSHRGPVWNIVFEEPTIELSENPDRWEIFTESTEKSLFELPDVVKEAKAHDTDAVAKDDDSYKKTIETIVDSPSTTFPSGALVSKLVRHLRAGVTGWQLDLVVLRRTRRLERYSANNDFRITLDTGLLLYTTSQLNVPRDVAFGLPETPPDIDDLFTWSWRKRSQRAEYVGNFVEQTVELLFAPWSTLAYKTATSSLAW